MVIKCLNNCFVLFISNQSFSSMFRMGACVGVPNSGPLTFWAWGGSGWYFRLQVAWGRPLQYHEDKGHSQVNVGLDRDQKVLF